MSHSFTLSQGAFPVEQLSAPAAPSSPAPEHSPRPRGNMPLQTRWMTYLLVGPHPRQPQKGPPAPSGERFKWSHIEMFSQDTSLVRKARREYFKKCFPNFTMGGTCDLSEVFRHMAESAKLLGSAIYEIQKVWEGPDEL